MTSFGWKRKIGSNVEKSASKKFAGDSKEHDEEAFLNGDVDWLTLAPKRQCLQLEDCVAKSSRLRQEGITLAESERFWEAIRKWDEALLFTSSDETLYEMKAQALISLGEVFPAVSMAEKAVSLNGRWWIAHQTLGRALLGMGEVKLALKSFCRALHLNPVDEELIQDDVAWSLELLNRKMTAEAEIAAEAERCHASVVELDDENSAFETIDSVPLVTTIESCDEKSNPGESTSHVTCVPEFSRLPSNYVIMRN